MVNGGNHVNGDIIFGGRTPTAHPQVEHRSSGRKWLIGGILFIVLLLLTLGGKAWMFEHDRSPIVTYESMLKPLDRAVYFSPDKAKPGEKVQLHFGRVYWYTTEYRSELIYNITCLMEVERNGVKIIEPQRRDFPPYPISTPKEVGLVDPKHRPITVPAECRRGPLVHRAFARHDRGWFSSRETPMPEVWLQVTD